jgi:TPR repeat protein
MRIPSGGVPAVKEAGCLRPLRFFRLAFFLGAVLAGLLLHTAPVYATNESTNEFNLETAQPLAEQGDAKAQFFMAKLYAKGDGVPKDFFKAVEYYRRSALQGYAKAQNNLAAFYARGWGVTQDFSEALKWFGKAAEQGDPAAEYSLGLYNELGLGVATNKAEALNWYQKAAGQNQPDAELALGNLYLLGDRDLALRVDLKKSVPWLEKAAAQGNASACNSLGFIYESGGTGVEKNTNAAVKWYRQAAEGNDGKGQMNLGRLYLEGQTVPQDLIEAYKWFFLASRNGDGVSRHFMQGLRGEIPMDDFVRHPLTGEQIKEAVQRALDVERAFKKPSQ